MGNKKLIGPFSQVLPLSGLTKSGALSDDQLLIIENGAIGVEDNRVVEVGTFEQLRSNYPEIEEVSGDAVALPGFVDCHTHMVWGGTRSRDYALRMRGESYEKILQEGGGIFDTVEKTREADKSALITAFERRAERHLMSGVTTAEVKSGYGLDQDSELKMLEVIKESSVLMDVVSTCLAAHVCPKEFVDKNEYLNHVLYEILPVVKEKGLASRVDAFIEPSAFPAEVASPYLGAAKSMGFELTVHADQFTTGGSELAVNLGAQSADHLEFSGEKEIEILAKSDVVAVALPGASIGLGMQYTPARRLLDAGAALAIATDWNPGSAPMGDLITQSAILGTFEKLSTAEIFSAITFRAANALGLDDRGILSSGKIADVVSFPTNDFREILYQQGMMKPNQVWKGAKKLSLF